MNRTMIKHAGYLAVALVLALFAASCGSKKQEPAYHILENSRAIEDSANYSIKMEYPDFISNKEKDTSLGLLNHSISSFLDTAAHYYWGTTPDSTKIVKDTTGAAGRFELDNTYEILDTTDKVISVMMETYSFALGAHGFTAIHTYNYDIEHQRMLKITDMLNLSAPGNVDLLNDLLKQYFVNKENCFNQDPTADATFKLFGLQPGFMVFYYEAYELGAYYCGSAKVKVPYDALEKAGLFRKEAKGLLTRMQ